MVELPLDIQKIKALIPHRMPFLLIDKVTELEPYKSCVAYKAVSYNEWFFQGHFPEHPVMPGVLVIESMAQSASVLALASMQTDEVPDNVLFASIVNVRFRKQIVPGDLLRICTQVVQQRSKLWKFESKVFIENELADEAEFSAMVA